MIDLLLELFIQDNQQARNCYQRGYIVSRLEGKYGESRQSFGMSNGGQVVMELWANEETGTWTITVSNSDKITCMIGSGDSYEELSEVIIPGSNL